MRWPQGSTNLVNAGRALIAAGHDRPARWLYLMVSPNHRAILSVLGSADAGRYLRWIEQGQASAGP